MPLISMLLAFTPPTGCLAFFPLPTYPPQLQTVNDAIDMGGLVTPDREAIEAQLITYLREQAANGVPLEIDESCTTARVFAALAQLRPTKHESARLLLQWV